MSAGKALPRRSAPSFAQNFLGQMGRPDAGRKGHASKNRLSRPGLPKDRP